MAPAPDQPLAALCRAVEALFRDAASAGLAPPEILEPAAGALRNPDLAAARLGGVQLPACRHLAPALQSAADGPLSAVAAAFGRAQQHFGWTQNPNYSAANMGADYMENYAYCELLGPRGLVPDHAAAVGFLLIGPGQHYPDHHHPAAEVYFVISGTADWRRGGENWMRRLPGACVYHAPNQVHAMRSGDAPLLALYCWRGDIFVGAKLSG